MTEFVPTHRIREGADICFPPIPDGTPMMVKRHDIHASLFVDANDRELWLNHDCVEPIPKENPVTELIPDKRYRWTVEGTANEYGLTLPSGGLLMGGTLSDGKAELLPDPLPATLGSVIRDRNGHLNVRIDASEYGWSPLNARGQYLNSDEQVSPAVVLFDAGADQ